MKLSQKQVEAMRLIRALMKTRGMERDNGDRVVDMAGLVHVNTLRALERRRLIELKSIPTTSGDYKKCGFSYRYITRRKVRQWVRLTKENINE